MPSTGRFASHLLLASLTALIASASLAFAGPPSQLYGKSVHYSWSEGRSQSFPDGRTNHRVVHVAVVMYVSENGRVFSQSARERVNQRGKTVQASARSKGPDGDVVKTANARYQPKGTWQGQTFASVVNYESGARRMVIEFDPSFSSCKLELTHGKEDGAPGMVMHGMNGKLLMLTNVSISNPSCSVRAGNTLAE